jgi:predicted DNA-binding protein (UPF0251 family)
MTETVSILSALVELRMTRKEVMRLVESGVLESVNVGHEVRISKESLDAMINKRNLDIEKKVALLKGAKSNKKSRYMLQYTKIIEDVIEAIRKSDLDPDVRKRAEDELRSSIDSQTLAKELFARMQVAQNDAQPNEND